MYFGGGAYTFETLYEIPIWLRKFMYSEIARFKREESERMEEAQNGGKTSLKMGENKIPAHLKQQFQQAKEIASKQPSYKTSIPKSK